MKKCIALLLALILAMSLVACGEEAESATHRRRSKTEDTTETVPEETEEETEEVTEEATEPETEESLFGVVDGNVYENTYLGFGLSLDSSWIVATAEETAEIMGMSASLMGIEEQLSQGVYCDFYAMKAGGGSLNIVLQEESIFTKTYKSEELLEASWEAMAAQFENLGMTDMQMDISTITFAEKQCAVLNLQGIIAGVNLSETMVLLREGDYMAFITVAGSDFALCNEILEQFYTLD